MKNISNFLGTLFTLFIAGAIVYGGIKEGYAIQTILILAVLFLIIYLSILRDDNIAKMKQLKKDKEDRVKFDEELQSFKFNIYGFAHINEIISIVTYDIEEGWYYLTQYAKNTCDIIDYIVERHIKYPNRNFNQFLPKIEEEVLKLSKKPKNTFVGF